MTTATLDADTRWIHRGCRDLAQLFDGDTEDDRREAEWICLHLCPVLDLCAEATRKRTDQLSGVIAGIYHGK